MSGVKKKGKGPVLSAFYLKRNRVPKIDPHENVFCQPRLLADQEYEIWFNKNPKERELTHMDTLRSQKFSEVGKKKLYDELQTFKDRCITQAFYDIEPAKPGLSGKKKALKPPTVRDPSYIFEESTSGLYIGYGHRPSSASRTFNPTVMDITRVRPHKSGKDKVFMTPTVLKNLLHPEELEKELEKLGQAKGPEMKGSQKKKINMTNKEDKSSNENVIMNSEDVQDMPSTTSSLTMGINNQVVLNEGENLGDEKEMKERTFANIQDVKVTEMTTESGVNDTSNIVDTNNSGHQFRFQSSINPEGELDFGYEYSTDLPDESIKARQKWTNPEADWDRLFAFTTNKYFQDAVPLVTDELGAMTNKEKLSRFNERAAGTVIPEVYKERILADMQQAKSLSGTYFPINNPIIKGPPRPITPKTMEIEEELKEKLKERKARDKYLSEKIVANKFLEELDRLPDLSRKLLLNSMGEKIHPLARDGIKKKSIIGSYDKMQKERHNKRNNRRR